MCVCTCVKWSLQCDSHVLDAIIRWRLMMSLSLFIAEGQRPRNDTPGWRPVSQRWAQQSQQKPTINSVQFLRADFAAVSELSGKNLRWVLKIDVLFMFVRMFLEIAVNRPVTQRFFSAEYRKSSLSYWTSPSCLHLPLSLTNVMHSARFLLVQLLISSTHRLLGVSVLLVPPNRPSKMCVAYRDSVLGSWPKYCSLRFLIVASKSLQWRSRVGKVQGPPSAWAPSSRQFFRKQDNVQANSESVQCCQYLSSFLNIWRATLMTLN